MICLTLSRRRIVTSLPLSFMTLSEIERELQTEHNQPANVYQPLEFRKFMMLPQEIQNLIWRHSLPRPFLIQINLIGNDNRPSTVHVWGINPPEALYICRESRREALSIYKPQLTFYTSRPGDSSKLCLAHDTSLLTPGLSVIQVFSKKTCQPIDFQPNSEVDSVVAGMNIERDSVECENWPPQEDELPRRKQVSINQGFRLRHHRLRTRMGHN